MPVRPAARSPLRRDVPGLHELQQAVDTGRWHVARTARTTVNAPLAGIGGHRVTDVAFVPPLHPAATRLEIIVTGPSSGARTVIPLSWQRLS